MTGHEAAIWGGVGGAVTVALEVVVYLKGKSYALPLNAPPKQVFGWLVVQVILIGLGTVSGYALKDAKQIDGVLGAIGSGVAAPEILKKAGQALA